LKKNQKTIKYKSKKKGKVEIFIIGFETIKQYLSLKIIYKLDITTEDRSYTVKRTYKEIKDLRNQLQKEFSNLPPLPIVRNGKKPKKKAIDELNTFLQLIIAMEGTSSSRDFVTFCIPSREDLRNSALI